MKLIVYILTMLVLVAAIYCSVFCFFYGMSMEDGVFMFLSMFFGVIAYYWNLAMKPSKNEYTKKIVNIFAELGEE